jgi:selenophosphate synthetase-related protein
MEKVTVSKSLTGSALLIAVNPSDTKKVLEALNNNGVLASKIGKIMPKEYGLKIKRNDGDSGLPVFERDEITKIFD